MLQCGRHYDLGAVDEVSKVWWGVLLVMLMNNGKAVRSCLPFAVSNRNVYIVLVDILIFL